MSARRILFGNNAGIAASRKNLLEFKAGKMTMKGKMVHPDKRKGLVYIHQTDDSLMHFCWKDRTSGAVVDDLIIFPDDAEYKRVNECKTGRVYVLRFKSSSRKFFFWMQESKTDKDDEYCTKVNELLNNPPAPGSAGSVGGSASGLPSELGGEGEFQNILNNMNQNQLMQLFGGMGGLGGMGNILGGNTRPSTTSTQSARSDSDVTATTTTTSSSTPIVTTASSTTSSTTATTTTNSQKTTTTSASGANASEVRLSDLQSILSNLNVPADAQGGGGGGGAATAATTDAAAQDQQLDLSTSLNTDVIQPLLSNPELLQQLAALVPQTPGSDKNAADEVKSTIQSPQFQQAMGMFSAALQSGQLGPLMNQFGMTQDVVSAATSGDMEAFIKALQDGANTKPKNDQTNPPKKDDKDDDEGMSLD